MHPGAGDDRILPLTRLVAVVVTPILLVAFAILYVRNDLAEAVFAWSIKPRLGAMLLGSAYAGGVVYFASLLAARQWHRVALGIPAVATFAGLLLVTTLLHLDLFRFDRVTGWVWTIVYVVAPPLVLLAWWRNRATDPGPQLGDARVDPRLVRVLLVAGIGAICLAAILYTAPELVAGSWPWHLTPLAARVLAPMLCLPGIIAIRIARDGRRSSLAQPLTAQAASIVLMLGALVARSTDLTGPPAAVIAAWLVLGGSLAGTVAILVWARRAAKA